MRIERRHLFRLAAAALPLARIAAAQANTTDIAVSCDLTLGPAVSAAGVAFRARSGRRVRVLPTDPGLLLPQIAHELQNDILVTATTRLDQAARLGMLASPPVGAWRNRLVLAGLQSAPPDAATQGPIAATDPTQATDLDGPAILARLGLHAKIMGVIDTDAVIGLLEDGTARAGLLYATDLRANPGLKILAPVADSVAPPITYAAAVTKNSWRPNTAVFADFLATPEASAIFGAYGLETAS